MPQFNKHGNRIRASDKSLVFRFSAGSLLMLFFTVVMLLNLKTIITTDWKSVSLFQDGSVHFTVTPYMIVTIVMAALVCGLAVLLYRRFQYDKVKQLFHRQKLAKMILENEWNPEVEIINPMADTVATATFQGPDVDRYIKVDDIVLKNKDSQPAGNPQNRK